MGESLNAPGLMRRLGAILYDLFLLIALLMLATALLMPLTKGAIEPGRFWYVSYLALVVSLYFGFFWIKRGQTLGMQTWRIRVIRADGTRMRPADAVRRLTFAVLTLVPLGVGLLWMLIDRDRLALHDRLSKTRLERVAKRASAPG